ncbi:MAG TPA: nitroreductase family deazaflavin-dependent oxidoreductase [Candidatus Limnocylindrales bacterium]|jgi:deazaflavin-dependent oxidoreductase (nitroreductase family)
MTSDANSWEDELITDLRANGGRVSQGPLEGDSLLVLYTTGAKSGERRRSIVNVHQAGDDYFVAGTAGGRPTNPAWIANIAANPDVTVEFGDKEFAATATILTGAERDRAWAAHVATTPRFAEYEAKVTARTIPMVRISPKA